jgi:hypothetical protein
MGRSENRRQIKKAQIKALRKPVKANRWVLIGTGVLACIFFLVVISNQ